MAWSKAFQSVGVLDELKRTITSLREQWRGTRRENERLRRENEQLRQQRQYLEQERERLREENAQLRRQLEEAQRASKRQTAPFSRRTRTPHPRRPGRKPGAAYGTRHSKPVPDHLDEVIAVPAPDRCACGGALDVEKIDSQYQHDIVRKTVWKRFDVSICRCRVCHQRVHGRDPRQTSDAFGAAGVQLGPDALALAVTMNKRLGLPHADVVTVLRDGFGLSMNRSTVCRAVTRVARRGEATWHALRDAARRSLVNAIDETGWNVAAQLHWLWVVVSEQITVCDILPGRGFVQAASLVGPDYDGWLTHDGWAVYYKFLKAGHQSCVSHLIRRCRDLAAVATPAAARFPLRVKALLEDGLALRDRYQHQAISLHGLWTATGRLEAKFDRVLARTYHDAANRRLAKHLDHERPYLFTFLYCPGLDATNNAAERAIRALIGARKNWGGNRTPNGAHAQAILTSLLQTAKQQGNNPFDVMVALLCCRERHTILDLVPLNRAPLQDSSPAPPPVAASDRFGSSPLSDLAVPA